LIKQIIWQWINWRNQQRFEKLLRLLASEHLLICDIDNTIADSWPSLVQKTNNETFRLLHLPVLQGTVNWLLQQKKPVVYISARHFVRKAVTAKWLQKNQLPYPKGHLLLVQKAADKMVFLQMALAAQKKLTYIDDLCYEQETGQPKYYTSLISQIRQMPLTYHDLEFIEALNKK
jgi:phosphatidate phosphatase APP1